MSAEFVVNVDKDKNSPTHNLWTIYTVPDREKGIIRRLCSARKIVFLGFCTTDQISASFYIRVATKIDPMLETEKIYDELRLLGDPNE